jgi:hypothetical protein
VFFFPLPFLEELPLLLLGLVISRMKPTPSASSKEENSRQQAKRKARNVKMLFIFGFLYLKFL